MGGFLGSQAFLQRKYGNLIRAWRQALSQTDSMVSWLPKKRRAPISNQGFDWAFNKGYKGLFGLRMITDSFPVCGKSIWIQKTNSQRDQNLIILPVGGRLLHFVKRVGNPTCTCDISAIIWIIWIRILTIWESIQVPATHHVVHVVPCPDFSRPGPSSPGVSRGFPWLPWLRSYRSSIS